MEAKEKGSKRRSPVLLIIIIVLLLAIIGLLVYMLIGRKEAEPVADALPTFSYESGVYTDEASLQAAVDALYEEAENDPGITVSYTDIANSANGSDVTCDIDNSQFNGFPVYFTLYADGARTDELYRSGLLEPGTGVRSLTLNHPMENGSHTIYLTYTRVREQEDGQLVADGEVTVTLTLRVG